MLPPSGKPRELVVPKEPLKVLKETLEQEGMKSEKKV
jgi:hypothetical protein